MICSYTQTYSDNRNELFYFHDKDQTDIYFRNKLDKNYYVFHNSSDNYIQHIIKSEHHLVYLTIQSVNALKLKLNQQYHS